MFLFLQISIAAVTLLPKLREKLACFAFGIIYTYSIVYVDVFQCQINQITIRSVWKLQKKEMLFLMIQGTFVGKEHIESIKLAAVRHWEYLMLEMMKS